MIDSSTLTINNFIFIDCKSLYNLRIFDIPALFISLIFRISKTTAGILIEQASSQSSTNFFISSGKTGLREYDKSNWCKKDKVYKELETLIKNANFKFIFLSYNDEGLLSLKQIKEIFESQGKYSLKNKTYKRFKADNNRFNKKDETIEYLHILIK